MRNSSSSSSYQQLSLHSSFTSTALRLTTDELLGFEACVAAIRGGECALALLDAGASENTLKRVEDACASHQVPLYRISPGALGHAIGKPGRMVISVPAGRMADKLLTYFQEQ